jgi:hypothetical protein
MHPPELEPHSGSNGSVDDSITDCPLLRRPHRAVVAGAEIVSALNAAVMEALAVIPATHETLPRVGRVLKTQCGTKYGLPAWRVWLNRAEAEAIQQWTRLTARADATLEVLWSLVRSHGWTGIASERALSPETLARIAADQEATNLRAMRAQARERQHRKGFS